MTQEQQIQLCNSLLNALSTVHVEPLKRPRSELLSSQTNPVPELPLLLLTGLLVEKGILVRDYPGSRLATVCRHLGHLIQAENGRTPFKELDGNGPMDRDSLLDDSFKACNVLLVSNAGNLPTQMLWQIMEMMDDTDASSLKPLLLVVSHDAEDNSGRGRFGKYILHHFLIDVQLGRLESEQVRFLLEKSEVDDIPNPLLSLDELRELKSSLKSMPVSDAIYARMAGFLNALVASGKTLGGLPVDVSRTFLKTVSLLSTLKGIQSGQSAEEIQNQLIKELAPKFLSHHIHQPKGSIKSPQTIIAESLEDSVKDAGDQLEKKFNSPGDAYQVVNLLRQRLQSVIVGRDRDNTGKELSTLDLILTAIIAEGHILLEDYPGSGKSFMAKNIGESIEDDEVEEDFDIPSYKRIQCTPDLLPSDVTGYNSPGADGRMNFNYGPLFAYVVLLDEINRTTPKVQSAMLEAMAEKQITVDGKPFDLGKFFFVIATMNPLDKVGTFPLPQAQLDRFLFKRTLPPIHNLEDLEKIARMDKVSPQGRKILVSEILALRIYVHDKVDGKERIDTAQALKALLILSDFIGRRCKGDPGFKAGQYKDDQLLKMGSKPSPRTLQRCLKALRAWAFLNSEGKNEVSVGPADIHKIAKDILRHRIFPLQPASDPQELEEQLGKIIDCALEEMNEDDEIKNIL